MAGFIAYKDRRIIPRWRSFDQSLRLGELDPIYINNAHYKISNDFLIRKINDWKKYKTVAHATDLVGSANLILKKTEDVNIIKAAKFLLRDDISASQWSREIAKKILNIPNTNNDYMDEININILHNQINHFRQLLKIEPKDPITWVELSRTYACIGLREQAEKSMVVALQLAMDNRFVLRSASRLWIYLDDIERAHRVLLKSDKTPHDPWLLSAEIAIGTINDYRKPKFIKSARKIILREEFYNEHISELASALATLELLDGSINKAKKLFRKSLIQPTENSVAQAGWASRHKPGSIYFDNTKYLQIPNIFEALSQTYYYDCDWEYAIQECIKWQRDQPFSSRPYGYISYIAAVALEDYSRSQKFAERGLSVDQSSFTLMNNLTYSLIKNNKIQDAKKYISYMQKLKSLPDREKLVLQATKGLWEFRNGNFNKGREFYRDALSRARKMKDDWLLASASVFYAFEEISQTNPDQSIIDEALHNIKRVNDPIFKILGNRLIENINK